MVERASLFIRREHYILALYKIW